MQDHERLYEEGLLDPMLMDLLVAIGRLTEDLMLDPRLKALDTLLAVLQFQTSFEDGVLERAGFVVQELNHLLVELSDIFEAITAAFLAISKRVDFTVNDDPEFRHVLDTVVSAIERTERIKAMGESLKDAEIPFDHASSTMELLDFADEPLNVDNDPFVDEEDDHD